MNNPMIRIILTDGRVMNAELYPEFAPATVDNFVKLAEEHFFDGLCFHRVIPDFMIQGGGFLHEKSLINKDAEHTVKGEFFENGFRQNTLKHDKGVLSMARTSVMDSASSQFFVCVADVHFLDKKYAAFGKLTDEESINTAEEISLVKTTSIGAYENVPVKPVVIKTVEVIK